MINETSPGTAASKPAATPSAPANKPDYKSWVGKSVITKNEKGLNAKTIFDIAEFKADVPFAPSGKKKPGFKLHRRNPGGVHWEACEDVVKNYDEWTDLKPAA